MNEALRDNEAIEARLRALLEELRQRVDSVDTRLAAAEYSASTSVERLRTMAESILDRTSDQTSDRSD